MQTDQTRHPPSSTVKRRADLAALIDSLQIQLRAAHDRISELCDRSGPEYLAEEDLALASWLACVAAAHPGLEQPIDPLSWPRAARVQLERLITKCRGDDLAPHQRRTRVEELQIHAEIHALCEANGCGPDLADAIILDDDDRTWQSMYVRRADGSIAR